MLLKFKKATSRNFNTFNRLFNEAITLVLNDEKTTKTREPLTLEEYKDWIKDSEIVLMYKGKKCVGYAEVSSDAYNKGDEQIVNIFIPEDLRRRGFGRQLVGHIEEEARKKGIHMLWTESEDMETDQFWTALSYRYNNKSYEYYKIITPKNEL